MSVKERAERTPEILRAKRARLFKAFDIYKQNVAYGLIEEDQDTHDSMRDWYFEALELNPNAILDGGYPEELEQYL